MSLVNEKLKKTWFQNFVCSILTQGPIPKHVAFIMDGNRRYARKNMVEQNKGHEHGFEKLAEVLAWCNDLDIKEVTVYAFSIENFKRSRNEVDGLMEMAQERLLQLFEEKEKLHKHGICVRFIGDITLLSSELQQLVAKAMLLTKGNTRRILNVCFSYTSRDEICAGMREIAEGVKSGLIFEDDITEDLLSSCFYLNKSADPDIIIRTSGEVRLSDFLLWQSAFSVLSFMKVLWPDITCWHLYGGILLYQHNYEAIMEAKLEYQKNKYVLDQEQIERHDAFKMHVMKKRDNLLVQLSNADVS